MNFEGARESSVGGRIAWAVEGMVERDGEATGFMRGGAAGAKGSQRGFCSGG